jgi:hypothetical protein
VDVRCARQSSTSDPPIFSLRRPAREVDPGALLAGNDNVVVAGNAAASNTTGYGNTATGAYSLQLNGAGLFNTTIGYYAMQYNIGRSNNTALGFGAGPDSNSANEGGNAGLATEVFSSAGFSSSLSPISPGRRGGRIPGVAAELVLRLGPLPRGERSALFPPASFSSGGLFRLCVPPQQQ